MPVSTNDFCSPSFSDILILSQLQQFRDEFQAIDRTSSGTINLKDFSAFHKTWDKDFQTRMDAKVMFNALSLERSYSGAMNIAYHEYVAACLHNRVAVDSSRIAVVFDFLDTENKGFIDSYSIHSALGDDLSMRDLERIVRECSPTGDDKISKR